MDRGSWWATDLRVSRVGYNRACTHVRVCVRMHTHTHDELEGFVTSLFQLETNVINKRQMPFCISRYDHVVSLL